MRKSETGKVKRESQSVEEMLAINLLFTSCLSLHIPSISSAYTSHTQQRCGQKCQTCAGLHQTFVESKRSLRGGNHWNMVKHGEILQVQKPLRNKSGNKNAAPGPTRVEQAGDLAAVLQTSERLRCWCCSSHRRGPTSASFTPNRNPKDTISCVLRCSEPQEKAELSAFLSDTSNHKHSGMLGMCKPTSLRLRWSQRTRRQTSGADGVGRKPRLTEVSEVT